MFVRVVSVYVCGFEFEDFSDARKTFSLLSGVSFICAVSNPYNSLPLIIEFNALNLKLIEQLLCSQNISNLFKTIAHAGILCESSLSISPFPF